jgi:hypothetical protein
MTGYDFHPEALADPDEIWNLFVRMISPTTTG